MSFHVLRRCRHCGTEYGHFMSGPQVAAQESLFGHCPTCSAAIAQALAAIPRKTERTWVPATDVPIERLLAWVAREEDARDRRRTAGELVPVRVASNLIDLEDPSNKNVTGFVRGRDEFEGRHFRYGYWTKKGPVRIAEEVERDIASGETRPWQWTDEGAWNGRPRR